MCEPHRPVRLASLVFSLLAAAGCAAPVAVPFRVVEAAGAEPLRGATSLRLVLMQGHTEIAAVEGPVAAGYPPLPEIAFGSNYRLRVEARDRDVVLARGSSFPFEVDLAGASPAPHVLLGRVGRFAAVPAVPDTTRPDANVVAAFPTVSGALLVTALGTVYLYRQHPSAAEPIALEVLAHIPSREGAAWCVLEGAGLLGVGGAVAGATLLDASGQEIATSVDAALVAHRDGASLIGLPGDSVAALVLGGATTALAPPTGAVTRLERMPDGSLAVTALPLAELPTPRARAGVALVHVDVGGVEELRVVVAGGVGAAGATGSAALVDPVGLAPSTEVALGVSLRSAAVVALSSRLVLFAGGAADDGIPSQAVRLLSADGAGLSVVAPPPQLLDAPRAGAGALMLTEGLMLLVGGTGLGGAPLSTAELVRVDLETFPGIVLPTGSLPTPQAAPRLVILGDGTVLSADASGLAFYIPPVELL